MRNVDGGRLFGRAFIGEGLISVESGASIGYDEHIRACTRPNKRRLCGRTEELP